jgi:CBS domain-containing membrane protein
VHSRMYATCVVKDTRQTGACESSILHHRIAGSRPPLSSRRWRLCSKRSRASFENEEVEMACVGDLMTREVAVLHANDALSIADDVMRLGRIRHMPVVEETDGEKTLVGIVSQRDLFRGALSRALGYGEHAQSKLIAGLKVKEVMTPQVHTATPDLSIQEAAKTMLDRKIGCLVVVEGECPIGIVTESNFMKLALE